MSTYKGVMYHGTDKNVVRMGEQERKRRLKPCYEMADYAYGFLKSKNLCVVLKSQLSEPDKEKLGDIWNDLRNYGMTKCQLPMTKVAGSCLPCGQAASYDAFRIELFA